jgi:predicted alpha-1,2-mannosidase
VGISYVSVANARAAVDRECRALAFDAVRNMAVDTWDASLNRIAVTGGATEQRTLFYTLFARLLCMPSDLGVDHEFGYWKSGVRHFTDYYCLWDSVRNANSLISLFDPQWEVDMLNCLLDVAEHRGWLPDAWIAGHSAFVQGGSSADILLCEAALKGLRGIDYEKALRFMRKNSEVESPDPRFFGRDLKQYRDLGYVSTDTPKACVSRHIEYAYQDWCIGALARKLGHSDVARRYEESSRKVWSLWRNDAGCFAPRNPDGSWAEPFDPTKLQTAQPWLDPHFYEAPSAQWTYQAMHDVGGLITRCGGRDEFVKRLDEFLANGYWSKEMMLHVPYLYIYAGRGDKTAEAVRVCMAKYFRATRSGLHDNEDMGCQSAFYMCSAIGVYPVAGQDIYLLSAPVFRHTEIALGSGGKTLVITAREAGERHPYVKSVALNGKPLGRQWIRHREIARGATIEFELSDVPVMHPEFMAPPNGV